MRFLLALAIAAAAPAATAQSVEAARKEGVVNVYSSNPAPTMQALVADFEKRYGVKVNLWRASSAKVLQRLVAEKKAGRWDFDAVSVSGPELEALHREGILQEIRSSALDGMLEGTVPPHRSWAPQFISVFVQAYNTNLVRQADLPKRWEDLLDPKWKGRLGGEATSADWYCTLAKHGKGTDQVLRQIVARNGLAVHAGNSVLVNRVGAGQVPFAISSYTHVLADAKERGAPIDWIVLDPLVLRVNGVAVSQKPPHPNAARLFYDYNLTEAQPLLVKLKYLSPVKKLASPPSSSSVVFADPALDSAEAERCEKAYESLIRMKNP